MRNQVRAGASSYPVVFCEPGTAPAAGELTLTADQLTFDGTAHGVRRQLAIRFSDLIEIRIGRLATDRINGYPTLVLERSELPAVQVAPVGAGLLHEIADLVATLAQQQIAAGERLSVVVPLKPGTHHQALQLLEAGPPLDPATLGLRSHVIYLRETEVVFLFEGSDLNARIKKAMRNPAVWRAGLAWQRYLAARPRIVEGVVDLDEETPAYSWIASEGIR